MSFPLRDSIQAERNECRLRTIKLRGKESGGDFYPPDMFEQWDGGGRCATPKIERKIVKRLKPKINWGNAHLIFVCRHARLFSINCYETTNRLKTITDEVTRFHLLCLQEVHVIHVCNSRVVENE